MRQVPGLAALLSLLLLSGQGATGKKMMKGMKGKKVYYQYDYGREFGEDFKKALATKFGKAPKKADFGDKGFGDFGMKFGKEDFGDFEGSGKKFGKKGFGMKFGKEDFGDFEKPSGKKVGKKFGKKGIGMKFIGKGDFGEEKGDFEKGDFEMKGGFKKVIGMKIEGEFFSKLMGKELFEKIMLEKGGRKKFLKGFKKAAKGLKGMKMGMGKKGKKGKMGMGKKGKKGGLPRVPIVKRVLSALGGREALMSLDQFTMYAAGRNYVEFESETPSDLAPGSEYNRTYSFYLSEGQFRTDDIVDPLFEGFAYMPRQQNMSRIISGDESGIIGGFGFHEPGVSISESVTSFKRQQMLFNPHFLLKQAMSDNDMLLSSLSDNPIRIANAVSDILLYVDGRSGYIRKLLTKESHPLLGDVEISVKYSYWNLETEDGLVFPRKIQLLNRDGAVLWEEYRESIDTDPMFDDGIFELPEDEEEDEEGEGGEGGDEDTGGFNLEFPNEDGLKYGKQAHHHQEGLFAAGLPLPHNLGYFGEFEITPGVFLYPSVSTSLAVVHSEGVLLIQGPISDTQGLLLLSEVARIAPNSTVTHLIQTHHHVIHSGGVRQIVRSTGATLVVGNGIAEFWEKALAAPSTIRPLLAADESYMIEEVGLMEEAVIIDDGTYLVTAYHTSMSDVAEDLLIITIDTADVRLLYQADLYANGPFTPLIPPDNPAMLFAIMRDLEIIDDECETEIPLFIVPAQGAPLLLGEALSELRSLNITVGCPPLLL